MTKFKTSLLGILLCIAIALLATFINSIIPVDLVGIALIALLLGMLLNPLISRGNYLNKVLIGLLKKYYV